MLHTHKRNLWGHREDVVYTAWGEAPENPTLPAPWPQASSLQNKGNKMLFKPHSLWCPLRYPEDWQNGSHSRLLTLDPFWALCVGWGRVQSILFHVDNPVVPAPLSCERTKVKQPLCPFSINSLEDTLKYHGQFCRFKPVVFKIWVSGTLCTLLKITKMLSHKAGNGGSCL